MEREKKPKFDAPDSFQGLEKKLIPGVFDYPHLFDLVLEHSSGLILLVDKEGTILSVNQSGANLLNGEPRDFVGKHFSEVFPDEYAEQRDEDMRKLIETGEKIVFQRPLIVGGRKAWLQTTAEPVRDPNGDVSWIFILSKDVTEQKEAEEALSETQAYYQALFQNAQEAIFLVNDEANILDANPAACEISGYSRRELVSSGAQDFFSSVGPLTRENIGDLMSEAGSLRGVAQFRTKDGAIIEMDYYMVGNIQPGQHLLVGRDVTEQKKIEHALFESEERYRRLFDSANDSIFLMDGDRFVSCNQATIEMYGCKDEFEVLNHTPWDFSPELQPDGKDTREKGTELIKSALAGEPQQFYWKHLKRNGTPFDAEVSLNAIVLRGKTFIQAIVRDITDRIQAEKELRESEARYSSLVNVSPNLILIVQDGKFVFANPAGAKILGYENSQDAIGQPVAQAISEKSRQQIFEPTLRNPEERMNEPAILEIHQPDGGTRMVESISIPYRYRERPASLVIGIDVTEKITQESMLSNFYKVAPLGVGVMVERKFVQFNERFCQMTGYSPEELADLDTRMLYFSDEEYESVGQQKNRQIKQSGIGMVETRFKRKDGSGIDVLLSSIPIDPDDVSKGLNTTALDISDRKRAEQMLKNLNEELEERVKLRTKQLEDKTVELESFSYSISHDLRAPLRAIHGFSQILWEEHASEWDEDSRHYLDNIISASQKMDKLIDGLLLLSRLGQKTIMLVPTDLSTIAREVFKSLSIQEPDRKIEFTASPCPQVWVDQQLMETALTNLIANAIKFTRTRSKARIEFGAQTRGEKPLFFVRDNGIGFDPKYADKLFSPFQRLESESDFEGTGIGLSIVRRIVERHQGTIWVEAEEDGGATFYFTLNADPSATLPENYEE